VGQDALSLLVQRKNRVRGYPIPQVVPNDILPDAGLT
jgi:hypothetical protein